MSVVESRTEKLAFARKANVPRGISTAHPIIVANARGAQLWDIDGNEYIDFVGGIGVMNVGHSNPKVLQAISAQLERITHACFQVAMYEPYIALASKLNSLAPGDTTKKTIFLTTGAEAVENAVKIARAYTRRPAIIAFKNGFHGRTLMGMSLTGKAHPYKQNFGPFAPEIYHADYPYEYRGRTGAAALGSLNDLFGTAVAPANVAAIIIEPVLGEGGFIPAPADFLQGLREICTEHGIVLVADEIQSGFGRTGKMFAIEHSGVVPDLITVAKSLAGGMPLSAVIGSAEIMDAPEPGGLGGTYGGNPVACAAGLAVLETFSQENLLDRARSLGEHLMGLCRTLANKHSVIGDVRGLGPMLGLEFVSDPHDKTPAPDLTRRVIEEARDHGLLLLSAGPYANVLRILVPLTVETGQLNTAFSILDDALTVATGNDPASV